MSASNKSICVRILEKDFQVACPQEQEETLREAARYLDKKMMQIRQSGKIVGLERIAIMAALNVTYELLNIKNNPTQAEQAFLTRIKVLQEKIDNACQAYQQEVETV